MLLILDEVDVSEMLLDEGEEIWHEKIHGKNEGYVLSGDYIEEILAVKARCTYPCEYLTWAQLKTLSELCSKATTQATYFDTKLGELRQATMFPELTTATKVLEVDGERYYGGITIKLEEK